MNVWSSSGPCAETADPNVRSAFHATYVQRGHRLDRDEPAVKLSEHLGLRLPVPLLFHEGCAGGVDQTIALTMEASHLAVTNASSA